MAYRLFFKKSVKKDLKRLGQEIARRILKEVREKLLPDPRVGKPLKGKDGVLWSYRAGDYRVIYTFSDKDLIVLVIRIGHRREIYR
ncbi:MAG: type II toxin-antitoxin system RelE/ParE family toxin [Candidatus Aminicenantes bacterium]|nr:type II toxin-antitoxin system RelE/ParE family toxin [Candidatus Aminicenantes bacterium]